MSVDDHSKKFCCQCQGGRVLLSMDCDVHPLFPGLPGSDWVDVRLILSVPIATRESVIAQWYPNKDCYFHLRKIILQTPNPTFCFQNKVCWKPFLFQNQDSQSSNSKTFPKILPNQSIPRQDPSQACLLKLLHMDMLASCVTLPAEKKWVWDLLAAVRTIGDWANLWGDVGSFFLTNTKCGKINEN